MDVKDIKKTHQSKTAWELHWEKITLIYLHDKLSLPWHLPGSVEIKLESSSLFLTEQATELQTDL